MADWQVTQPLALQITATANASGAATFTFARVPLTQLWTGTVGAATAPDTASFSAATGATYLGTWIGSNSFGPVQFQNGDQLVVTASGLVPNTQYVMTFSGSCVTGGEPDIEYAIPYANTVTTSTQQIFLYSTTQPATANPVTYTIQLRPQYRSVYVVIQWPVTSGLVQTAGTYSVVGNQSGLTYNTVPISYVPTTGPFLSTISQFRIPVLNGIDTSLSLKLTPYTAGGDTQSWVVWYGADLAIFDTAIYDEVAIPVTMASPSVGFETYTVGGSLRATLTTTATGAQAFLAAPAAGKSYRIQYVSMVYAGTASTTPVYGYFSNTGLATLVSLTAPYCPTVVLNGLIVSSGAIAVVPGNNSSTTWVMGYDIINTPTIT